jgi:hypothetical protein
MFPEQLKKILNLIKKTGDRVIIFDSSAPDDSYVIMDFDVYASGNNQIAQPPCLENKVNVEKIPINIDKSESLTEEDLTDKINREISMWKNRDNSAYLAEEDKPKKAWQIPPIVKDKAQEIK